MNMKIKLILCSLLLLSSLSFATPPSLTNVTVTLTDPSGQPWANATWRAELIPPFGNPSPLNNNGNPPVGPQTGTADGTGTFTVSLDDNIVLAPSGSVWKFTLCPNAAPVQSCSFSLQVVHGASQNLSASISADIANPVVSGNPTIARAYKDAEVFAGFGGQYLRVSDGHLRICPLVSCSGAGFVDASSSTLNPIFTGLLTTDSLLVNNNASISGTLDVTGLASFHNCVDLVVGILDFTHICPQAGGPFAILMPQVSGTLATLNSPIFTGNPTAPTPLGSDDSSSIATTHWFSLQNIVTTFNGRSGAVVPTAGDYTVSDVTGAAPLASPTFTGNPAAPTQAALDNSTKVATTAYVDSAVTAGIGQVVSGNGYVKLPGGVIIQWLLGAASGAGEGTQTESWPLTWPTGAFNVQVSYGILTPSASDDCWYQVQSFTTTQVVIRKQGTGGTCQDSKPYIYAIGH